MSAQIAPHGRGDADPVRRQSRSGKLMGAAFAPIDLDEIRRNHSLADVVGAVVPLKRAGREL